MRIGRNDSRLNFRQIRPVRLKSDADTEPFSILDARANASAVAYLVEMDHFIAEKSPFRLACVRYLASRGWRWFGEEVDPRVGRRLDEYLQSGDESFLAPIDEEPWYRTGILAKPAGEHDDLRMQRDRANLLRAVRRAAPESRWFGFDICIEDDEYIAAANAAASYADLDPVMALRERLIHRRVDDAFAANPEEKIALLAGSLHLMKNDDLVGARGGTGPGGSTVSSIGHHVAQDLVDGPVLAIWLLFGDGNSANPYLPPPGALRPNKGTLNEALLREFDEPTLLLVEPDDDARRTVTHMHNLDLRCRLNEQVDAILWVPHVTPLVA